MTTPTERITEYLRQRKRQSRDLGSIIHNSHTDPNTQMASLTIGDLEEVLVELANLKEPS